MNLVSDSCSNVFGKPVSRLSIILSAITLFIIWAILRTMFFEGFSGFDDIEYVRFALLWDRLPANHWESRLLFNAFLKLCFCFFGYSEFVSTLPTLIGSLVFMYCVYYISLHLWGVRYAFFAGLLAAFLPRDIISSTTLGVFALANMFVAIGTVCILIAKNRWQYLLGGCFLGIAIFTHLFLVFYVGIFALALWGYKWPELQWGKSCMVIVTALLTFTFINFVSFYLLTNDPLYQFKIVSSTHLRIDLSMNHIMGNSDQRINPINYDLFWFFWPIWNFIISKSFGLLVSISVFFTLISWKKQLPAIRCLCILVVLYWAWVCYGTQIPNYVIAPHKDRYWYPIALPVCILATQVFVGLKYRVSRFLFLGAAVLLPIVLLLSNGPWGQNIEITKELKAYAENHPDTKFVTEKYTLDEMYILNGAKPPENVFSIKDFVQPAFFDIPEKHKQDSTDQNIVFMYNEQNMWRPFATEYKELIKNKVKLKKISDKEYRLLSYCLPKSIRAKFNWMVRKQPAKVGKYVMNKSSDY